MQIFGLTITRAKATPPQLQSVDSRGGWWPVIRETFTGAWQAGEPEIQLDSVQRYFAVYACVSLIAQDIAKMGLHVMEQRGKIWAVKPDSPHGQMLRRPNRYQTRKKFIEWWLVSKLFHGNAYVLKQRDDRGMVQAGYILDPLRVKPLVAEDGSVFYQLQTDNLSGLQGQQITVPAREVFHDVMVPLYHPLVGVSPIYAAGIAAMGGSNILKASAVFFGNGSQPGGVLTAPGFIKDETATRLKAHWEENFTGTNVGKVAVLGDGLKYEPMSVTAVDAQLIEQLKFSATIICSCFHVPPYMIGVEPPPKYDNIGALTQQYYNQCLQSLIESIESVLDDGLELPSGRRTEFDLEDLLRMDSATVMKTASEGVKGAVLAPNEARQRLNLPPVAGGETPYLQEQNFSLEALNRRETTPPTTDPSPAPPDDSTEERAIARYLRKRMAGRAA